MGRQRWKLRNNTAFFLKTISWEKLNWRLARNQIDNMDRVIFAGEATTITKAGKSTYGIGRFFSSIYSKTVRGLSFQTISLIDPISKKSWPLLIEKILPKDKKEDDTEGDKPKIKRGRGRPKGSKNKNKKEVELKREMTQLKAMIARVMGLVANVISPSIFCLRWRAGE